MSVPLATSLNVIFGLWRVKTRRTSRPRASEFTKSRSLTPFKRASDIEVIPPVVAPPATADETVTFGELGHSRPIVTLTIISCYGLVRKTVAQRPRKRNANTIEARYITAMENPTQPHFQENQ